MAIDPLLRGRLFGLAHSIGSIGDVESLPTETIIYAACHGDSVIGITDNPGSLQLNNIVGNYTVFNRRLKSVYSHAPTNTNIWGNSEVDIVWLVQVPSGGFFYIAYNDGTHDRLIMVVRV